MQIWAIGNLFKALSGAVAACFDRTNCIQGNFQTSNRLQTLVTRDESVKRVKMSKQMCSQGRFCFVDLPRQTEGGGMKAILCQRH